MWKIHQSYNWKDLEEKFTWVQDMQNVPQDPIHHAEGNVDVHTQMVLNELIKLSEFKELNEQDQHILIAAALMHDIEKRSTTVIEKNGSISSAFHAKRGENTVREILYKEVKTPFEIREQIVKLVRYHGQPLWILDKSNPEKAVVKLSFEVNTKLLAILATADVKGRIAEDKEDLLTRIELFEEYCSELNCWGNARKFETDLAKYHYFTNNSHISYVPFENESFEVILLSALPGSGKDYHIKENYDEWQVISLDNMRRKYKASPVDKKMTGRIVQEAKEMARKHMRAKQSFVWNATNLSSSLRKSLIDLFVDYGARVKIVYIEVPYQRLVEQNLNRENPIPHNVMDKMISKWEVPQMWESHIVDYNIA
ncbi:MAG: AAA family ATPase [Bacteroidota bacterium]